MAERAEGQLPFDERAALAELERLRQGIEHYRQQRKKVGDQFDQFVSTFKTSAAKVVDPLPGPGESGVATGLALPEPIDALTVRLRRNPSEAWPVSTPDRAATPGVAAPRVEVRQRSSRARMVVLWLLFVSLVALVAWSLWIRPTIPSTVANQAAASVETTKTPQPVTQPAPPALPSPAADVTITRSVWLRVTVDGERVLERQLPADTRIPLTPKTTIVIRTGDAGAVRLSIDGKDQGVLGRDGEVVTRSFSIPPKTPR